MRDSWRLAIGLSALTLAAAACGTTVPGAAVGQSGEAAPTAGGPVGSADGLGPLGGTGVGDGPVSAEAGGVDPATAGSGTAGRAQAEGRGTAAGPAQQQQPSTGGDGTGGVVGPGVTDSTITIGALTANKAGEYQRSLGFDKGATGDQNAMTRSVVDWLNERGGLGGRKIELVVHDVDPVSASSDPSATYEAACTAFTQDDEVFAVASIVSHLPPNFYECLRKAGVIAITANPPVSSRFFRERAGTVYAPNTPSYTRILADSVDALWAAGWLTASSTVGVVGFDNPDAHATVKDGLLPALERHGLDLDAELYTTEDSSAGASAYSGGVLKFKTEGVDRVFFAPGGQPIYFGLAAEQSAYHPFYSMSTMEYPGPVAATLPASQLRGSAGLGWSPYLDLDNASAAKVATPGKAQCVDAVKAARQDLSTGTTLAIATWICDDWFFLRDALARTSVVHRLPFRSAVEGLGRSFRSANTFETYFAPGRTFDGAAAYRLNRYDDACSCYQYASPARPMP